MCIRDRRQAIEIFEGVGGFDVYSTYDCRDNVYDVFTFDFIKQTLADGNPIMVGWNDWGGHWQVIIGYDTMGTETTQDDVIIVAAVSYTHLSQMLSRLSQIQLPREIMTLTSRCCLIQR